MSPRTWIIGALCVVALTIFGTAQCSARRTGVLEERIHVADSTARADSSAAVAANQRADAEHVRAEREKAHADSLTVVAQSAGRAVAAVVERASSARAAVDAPTFAALPASVQRALEEGDSLRLAVTPMIARYESAIAAHVATEARLELTIARKDSALTALSAALAARDVEVRALEQLKAPRCGWRCGALITVGVGLLVPHVRDIADVVSPLFSHHSAGAPRP